MPIVVDHDERRDFIAKVVKQVIADHGMDAVTIRNVAREAGFKSALISHYFKDKQEMLIFTLESIRVNAAARVESGFEQKLDLEMCFDSLLPIEPDSLSDWQAWFGIWGKTTTDEEMTAVRLAISEATHMYLKRVLDGAKARGELPQDLDSEMHGRRLQMILNGIASLVVINPSAWPAETQRAMFAAEIELMRQMPVIMDGPDAIDRAIAARA